MQKKDFWTLMGCNIVTIFLLIEHFCHLQTALECLIIWQIFSLCLHIYILRDYVRLAISVEEIECD